MFLVSYAFAMLVAVICGLANDLTGDARAALLLIATSILPLVLLPPTIRFQRDFATHLASTTIAVVRCRTQPAFPG